MPHCPPEKLPIELHAYEWEMMELEKVAFDRQLLMWGERFGEVGIAPDNSEVHFTGIGGVLHDSRQAMEKVYRDGQVIGRFLDLLELENGVPETMFLVSSPADSRHLEATIGLAKYYKEMFGVENVIMIATTMAHERQDGFFADENENFMREVPMLDRAIESIGVAGAVDGVLTMQVHSPRLLAYGVKHNLPILPLDMLGSLTSRVDLGNRDDWFYIGPDQGRDGNNSRIAEMLKIEYYCADKARARSTNGNASVGLSDDFLKKLEREKRKVLTGDDEIRTGSTMVDLAKKLGKYNIPLTIVSVKTFLAGQAVTDLSRRRNIEKIVTTDAVKPQGDVRELERHVSWEVMSLKDDIQNLVYFLQHNLVGNLDDGWLMDPDLMGTQLVIDSDLA